MSSNLITSNLQNNCRLPANKEHCSNFNRLDENLLPSPLCWLNKQKSECVRKTGCLCIRVGIFREKPRKYPNVAWSDINWIKSPSRIPFQISFSTDFCIPRITYTRWQFYFVYGVPVSTSFHRKSVPIYVASKVVHTY